LVIARADSIPTYNFAVVVDDWDMRISHVFRGDEHVNNTPWQINIFNALGAPLPAFAHVPIILGDDGQKLSKRRGAVSVTAYEDEGYLPEAMLNYLARLGWSHGDEEIFTREQMVAWFDGSHLSRSPAQWDRAKLDWVNAHYLRALDPERLLALATAQLARRGIAATSRDAVLRAAAVFKDRCSTGAELADWLAVIFADVAPSAEDLALHVTDAVRPALAALRDTLATVPWDKASIAAAIKATLAAHGLKMPQLAPAVRVLVCGRAQTPSLDAVLEVFERATVLARLARA
jgi:glutamyl-tRNA synthetase